MLVYLKKVLDCCYISQFSSLGSVNWTIVCLARVVIPQMQDLNDFVVVYFDDIIIFWKDLDPHYNKIMCTKYFFCISCPPSCLTRSWKYSKRGRKAGRKLNRENELEIGGLKEQIKGMTQDSFNIACEKIISTDIGVLL